MLLAAVPAPAQEECRRRVNFVVAKRHEICLDVLDFLRQFAREVRDDLFPKLNLEVVPTLALLTLLLHAVQAIITIRVSAFRATLSLPVFGRFFVYGFLAGPFAAGGFGLFFNPLSTTNPAGACLIRLVIGIAVLLALVFPVLTLYRSAQTRAGLSIADGFLMAWACGFGFDFQRQLFASLSATLSLKDFVFFPPGLLETNTVTAISCSYLAALPILALSGGLRFVGKKWMLWLLFGITAILSGLVYAEGMLGQASPIPGSALLLQSELPYWLAFLGLIALEVFELRWVRMGISNPDKLSVSGEWRATVTALLTGRWAAFREAEQRLRLTVRAQLLGLEQGKGQANARLGRSVQQLHRLLDSPAAAPSSVKDWGLRTYRVQAAVLLLLMFLLFPGLATWKAAFWQLPILHFSVTDIGVSLLSVMLAGYIVWRYISAPSHASSTGETEDEVRFLGEQAVMRTALGTVILVLFWGNNIDQLYPLASPISALEQIGVPGWPAQSLASFVLLVTAAATGVQLAASLRWRQAEIAARRRAAIEHSLQVAVLILGAWLCSSPFRAVQVYLHAHYGDSLYNWFGGYGNQVGESLTGVLMFPVVYGVFFILFRGSARARRFLCEEPKIKPQAKTQAAAAN